uniref:Uncharacterized protein n=1 Tax=viral metagenome TaxID=1070528 RepID=A0A6C0KMG9_9ZZZZ
MAAGNQITLPDFYTTFWHCDVKKDHPEAYTKEIAPVVLQDILPQGGDINEELFRGTCFHNLFNHVVSLRGANTLTRPFDFFKNHVPITENFNDPIENPIPNIQVTDFNQNNIIYEYVCIHRNSFNNPTTISNLQTFLGSDIVKFTDTHAHIDDLHTTWSQIEDNQHKIYQVRSREIQMDPASKIIPSSCGDPNMYYLEKKPDANSLSIEYPRYTRGDPASYFYSKYPVFLDHRGYEQNGYNLKTQFSYKKGSRKIVVGGDRNTANVKTDLYFAALENSQRELEKELIEGQILAKAHGDIGQVLGLFRDMDLMKYPVKGADNNPKYSQEVNTFTGLKVFESHDTNPITKAFTLGIDCIWMHVLGHDENKKLIIFKKQNFGTAEEKIAYDEARLASRITSLKNNILDLSGNLLDKLNSANAKLNAFYNYIIEYSLRPTDTNYKSILKRFAWLSIISGSIRDMENYVKEGKSLFDSITPLLEADINKAGLERDLQSLSNQLYTLHDIVDIDLSEENFNSFKMEDVGGVLLQSGEKTFWKNKVYETVNLFDCIDLDDGGARSVRASETKSLQSWGISIIHDLYFGYHLNKAISDIFIRLLYNTLGTDANKKKKFKDLLSTIEILDVDNIDIRQNLNSIHVQIPVAQVPAPAPQRIAGFFSRYYNNIKLYIGKLFTNFSIPSPTIFSPAGSKRKREPSKGGSKYSNKTFKRRINKKRITYKQKGGTYVELPEEFVNTLITEIREQVDFLINITYATKLEKNMTKDILNKWWGDIEVSSNSDTEGTSENNSNTNVKGLINFNDTPKEKSCSYSVNEIQTMITILLSLYNSSERKEEISRILFDIQYMLLSFYRDLDISGVKDISALKVKQNEFLKDHYDIEYLEDVGEVKRRRVEDNQGVDRILDEALGVPESAPDSGERTPVNQGIGSQVQLPKSGNSQASTAQLPLGSPLGSFQQPLSLATGSQPSGEGSASVSAVVSPFGSPIGRRGEKKENQSSSDSEAPPQQRGPSSRKLNLQGGLRRSANKQKSKNKKKSKNPLYSKTYKGKHKF